MPPVRSSNRSSELRVPTTAVAVRLALVGGMPAPAELFVADVPRRGRSHLLDDLAAVVAAPARFLPVRSSGRVRLLGKHAISWIAVRRRDPDQPPATESSPEPFEELTLYDHEHIVELELVHGTKLIGTLLGSPPADRTRAIDHLNRAEAFVRLWTAEDHYLVNTLQIVCVTEIGEAR